jgi:hypothetical protein
MLAKRRLAALAAVIAALVWALAEASGTPTASGGAVRLRRWPEMPDEFMTRAEVAGLL